MSHGARIRFAAIACAVSFLACAKAHRVVPEASAIGGEYLYYSLPRAVVSATVVVSVSTVDPNPTCAGTPEMRALGLEAPKITRGKFLTIHEVTLGKFTEADPDARYAIDLDSAGSDELGATFNVGGALTKGSSESTDIIMPIVIGATELTATVAGKVLFGAPGTAATSPTRCARASASLQDVRGRLLDLDSTHGAADPKEVLEFKAAKLTVLAKLLEAPFTGVKAGKPQKLVCQIRPASAGNTVLFEWKKSEGLTGTTTPGCQIPDGLTIQAADRASSTDAEEQQRLSVAHTLSLKITATGTDLSNITPKSKKSDRSFYYRIPAFAELEVGDTPTGGPWSRQSDRVTWPLPQLGKIHSLPRVSSTGNVKLTVSLDAETGALLEATVKSQEADFGAALASAAKSTSGVLQARKEGKGDDELEKLKREQAVLEARVAIKVAKEALGEE